MQSLLHFIEEEFFWCYLATLGWLAFIIIASVIYRWRKGKLVFSRVPEDALFTDHWISGRVGAWGGAQNCLTAAVTRKNLVIFPQFPFTLMFIPEIFGFEITIPREAIRDIGFEKGMFKDTVTVVFEADKGKAKTLRLFLKKTDGFSEALHRWWMAGQRQAEEPEEFGF